MKIQNNYKSIFSYQWSFKRTVLNISFLFLCFGRTASMDASHPWQMGFQDPATPIMEGIIFFNGLLMTFMIFIACLVGWLLYKSLTLFDESVHANPVGFTHSTLLEVVWTIIPAGILMLISIPSYNLLYAMDEVIDPSLTIKVVGHQWYWSYECSDFMISPESLEENESMSQATELDRINLSVHVDRIESMGVEADKTETQIQLSWVQGLLRHLKDQEGPLSVDGYHNLGSGLSRVYNIMENHEHLKEWYTSKDSEYIKNGRLLKVLPDPLIEKFWTCGLEPKKEKLVFDLIRDMQRYARLSGDLECGVHDKEIASFLALPKKDDDDGGSRDVVCHDDKSLGSDKEDNNVITDSDLKDFDSIDEQLAFNRWCYTDSKMYDHYRAVGDLESTYSKYLVSQRIVNNAVTGRAEDKSVPVAKCIEDIVKDDDRVRSKRRIMQTAEDKMFDSELMKHHLRFTESEREALSGKFVLDRESASVGLAQENSDLALKEFYASQFYWSWSQILADSAKVNKLTADYLVAEASLNNLDPRVLRSIWLNSRGYYSWNRFIRLVAKKLIEKERTIFVHAQEKLTRANFHLANAQKDLTVEELNRSDAIADDAKGKFMAMEREMVPAYEEFQRGQVIAKEATAELKAFEALLEQAGERLGRAEKTCEAANKVLIRSEARLQAAKSCFKSLEESKSESEPSLKPLYVEGNLAELEDRIKELKEAFGEGAAEVKEAKSHVFLCGERITDVVKKVIKTEMVFENMSLLGIELPMEGYPKEYYPNYYWEIRKDDVAFIKEKLVSEEEKLNLAKASLNALEASANKIGAQIMEAELEVAYLSNSEPVTKGWSVDQVRSVEICKAKAYHSAALEDFKLDPSPTSHNVLDLATKSLATAKLSKGSELSYKCLDIDRLYLKKGMDPAKMFEDYGKRCAKLIKEETPAAMEDYEKAGDLFLKVKRVLKVCGRHLPESPNDPFHFYFTSHFNRISDELKRCVSSFSEDRSNFTSSDITLESGSVQKKSYEHVLSAKKVLAASKWLALFIHDVYDIPLADEVKPFNIEFSHLLEQIETRPHINRDTYENWEDVALSEILAKKANLGDFDDENKDFSDDQGDKNKDSTGSSTNSVVVETEAEKKQIMKDAIAISEILAKKSNWGGFDEENKDFSDDQGDKNKDSTGSSTNSVEPAKKQPSEGEKPEFSYTRANLSDRISNSFAILMKDLSKTQSRRLTSGLKEAATLVVETEGEKNQVMKDAIARVKEELEVHTSIRKREEFVSNEGINFDSYLIADEDLVIPEVFGTGKAGKVFRLLEVDNRLVIPINTHIRMLITSADVLHSWAVPSLGVKVDACPGRLNQVFIFVKREGVFYGQCSELCGVNHGFMPIVVQAVSQEDYLSWVGKRLCP